MRNCENCNDSADMCHECDEDFSQWRPKLDIEIKAPHPVKVDLKVELHMMSYHSKEIESILRQYFYKYFYKNIGINFYSSDLIVKTGLSICIEPQNFMIKEDEYIVLEKIEFIF